MVSVIPVVERMIGTNPLHLEGSPKEDDPIIKLDLT